MKTKLIDINGVENKEIELNDLVFNIKPSKASIYEVIKNELANLRQGTHSTKTKAEVSGSGAKPHKQKGTGSARVGTKRSPVWRGGGITFGPKPRDYSYKLNKKFKRLAFRSILSMKNQGGILKVIENFKLDNNKTKEFVKIFKPILNEERSTLILNDSDEANLIKRAGKNLPWIKCISYNRMKAHTLYYSKNLILTEEAALKLNDFLAK